MSSPSQPQRRDLLVRCWPGAGAAARGRLAARAPASRTDRSAQVRRLPPTTHTPFPTVPIRSHPQAPADWHCWPGGRSTGALHYWPGGWRPRLAAGPRGSSVGERRPWGREDRGRGVFLERSRGVARGERIARGGEGESRASRWMGE
jgi:hypothetical protein